MYLCVCVPATLYLVDTRMYDRYYQGKSNYIHTQASMNTDCVFIWLTTNYLSHAVSQFLCN